MRRLSILALAAAVVLSASPAAAKVASKVTDCPLRDTPFSLASPFMDILLSPAASAVVDSEAPGLLAKLPPRFAGKTAPSFAAILTLREASGFLRLGNDKLEAIGEKLKSVPVTQADREARCVRYDNDRPDFTLPAGRPRILLFEKMTGFRDGPSVEAAHAAFVAMAQREGWAMVATDKGGAMTPSILSRFDAVIWNNVSGDVLTLSQRKAFQDYLNRGGGFIGIHGSAGDPVSFWDWYVDTLIGARFAGHPLAKQFQDARIVVEGKNNPVAQGLPAEWVMNDEWYSFRNNPRSSGSTIIATLDEASYAPVGMGTQNLRMGDHPIVWTRCVGRGRIFYSAIGHRPETYSDPRYVTLLENAVGWVAGARGQGCTMGARP
ncbi:MAG TPA: ThuA domain-containing protein [Sphingobium sp.]